ncbi:MAG TPA: alpha/beta hydrolase [Candidatus Binataceae bacterium]|nr:alpha/beta hydrolase [Candidatus Binataceae bacterium]
MNYEQFWFTGADGLEIATFRWPAQGRAAAIVQIAHGMAEHAQRYDHVAAFLNRAGYHVYANDHRGHGVTGTRSSSVGSFGASGWNALVDDVVKLTKVAREREHGLPVILLGHSMGSIAAQQYILDHSADIAAVALSGSVATDLLAINSNPDGDLTALNKVFEPARTPFDWLSRDPAEVDKYVADPLCGYQLSPDSMMSLGASMMRLGDAQEIAHIRKDLPIYIFAGDADPLNQKLEWLKPVAERYRAAGIKDVSEKYYPEARHEVLNEINRDEVMGDLLAWIKRAVR